MPRGARPGDGRATAMIAAAAAAKRELLAWRIDSGTKRCSRCATVKGITEFGPQPSSPDGRHGWCRPCCAEDKRLAARAARQRLTWRTCTKCGRQAPPEQFTGRRGQPVTWCPDCRARDRERRRRRDGTPPAQRRCVRCRASKPVADFADDGESHSTCAACRASQPPPKGASPQLAARLAELDDADARRAAREAARYRPARAAELPCCTGSAVITADGRITGREHDPSCIVGRAMAARKIR